MNQHRQQHEHHLSSTQAEQAANLIGLVNERLQQSRPYDRSAQLAETARAAVAELLREIGR